MHQPKSALDLNHFDSSPAPKVCYFDGQKLHKVVGTAFARIFAQRTATAGATENLERKQILRPVMAKRSPNKEPSPLRAHQQKQSPDHPRRHPGQHDRTHLKVRTVQHQGVKKRLLRRRVQQNPLHLRNRQILQPHSSPRQQP